MIERETVVARALRSGLMAIAVLVLAGCATSHLPDEPAATQATRARTTHDAAPVAVRPQSARRQTQAPAARGALHSAEQSAHAPAPAVATGPIQTIAGEGRVEDVTTTAGNEGADVGGSGAATAEAVQPAAAVAIDAVDPGHAPRPSANAAVNALLAQADGARRGGDLNAAIASAERALRIAPADAAVYYELALLRLANGERAIAGQLARKGLSCRPDEALRQRLEDLIARAHSG